MRLPHAIRGTAGGQGFALLAPIFLIVVIAALGVYIATLSSTSNLTAAAALRGNQAHLLARSGVQWAARNIIIELPSPGPVLAASLNCGAATPVAVTLGGGPPDYQLSVTCVSADLVTEGAHQYYIYRILATATHGAPGRFGYVTRTVVATLRGCRTEGVVAVSTCL